MNRDDVLQLIPAYVLGALETDERSQVEQLLAVDGEAQAMEQQYRQIVMVLPLTAVHRQPSPNLKNRLLARLQGDELESVPPNVIDMPKKKKRKRSQFDRRLILPVVAGLVLAIVGLGFVLTREDDTPSPQAVFYTLLDTYDSEQVPVSPSEYNQDVEGSLIISGDSGQAVLRVSELPVLTEDQTFQLWLIDTEGSLSGGIYQADESNRLYIVIPNEKPIDNYVQFGVSIEPAGGSPLGDKPSGNRVFGVAIPKDKDTDLQQ